MQVTLTKSKNPDFADHVVFLLNFCELDIFRKALMYFLEEHADDLQEFFKDSKSSIDDITEDNIEMLQTLTALKLSRELELLKSEDISVSNDLAEQVRMNTMNVRNELFEYFIDIRPALGIYNKALSDVDGLKRKSLITTLRWLRATGKSIDEYFKNEPEETKALAKQLEQELD
jgi:hypothetical protein